MITKVEVRGDILRCNNVSSYVNIREGYTTASKVVGKFKKGDCIPYLGFGYNDGKDTWYAVETLNGERGFVNSLYSTPGTANTNISTADANELAKKLIENDRLVYDRILMLSATISDMKNRGFNVSVQESRLKGLNENLSVRQAALKNSKWFHSVKVAQSTLWEKAREAYNYISAQVSGIGLIPLAVVAAVAGVSLAVGAGGAALLYYCLKPKYDESKVDLKACDDLKTALKTIGDERAKAVLADLEKQIDDAYNNGRTDGTLGGFFSAIKPLAIGALGFFLITKFINSQKR